MGSGVSAHRADIKRVLHEVYMRASASEHDAMRITYLSDVEGHWDYFCNWVELSSAVSFCCTSDPHQARSSDQLELELADGWQLVFGGDSCDKGPGSLRFLESIVRLKKKYPDRVHLILGNRDINKFRLTAEVAQSEVDRFAACPAAYWLPENRRITYHQYLQTRAAEELGIGKDAVTEEMIVLRNSRVNKLKFLFDFDMGSNGEFEFRREELAVVRGVGLAEIEDTDVLQSYLDSLKPGGWMREYLVNAQIGVLLDGCLFVHGQIIGNQYRPGLLGVDANGVGWSIGCVPGVEQRIDDVQEWLSLLNAWATRELEAWEQSPTWEVPPVEPTFESWSKRGGSELLAYGTPWPSVPTVVYTRWLASNSMPLKYPPELVAYLNQQGIRYVVVGHTPHGNAPTIIPHDGVTVVMADTSFSHMNANVSYRGDHRGAAVSNILLHHDTCQVKGYTEHKQVIDYSIHSQRHLGDPYIGFVQDESSAKPFFVKAKLPACPGLPTDSYLMTHIRGHTCEYVVVSDDDLRHNLGTHGCRQSNSSGYHRTVCPFQGDEFAKAQDTKILEHIFQSADRNHDGAVDKKELLMACTGSVVRDALIALFPEQDLDSIFDELDADGNGCISFDELVGLLKSRPGSYA